MSWFEPDWQVCQISSLSIKFLRGPSACLRPIFLKTVSTFLENPVSPKYRTRKGNQPLGRRLWARSPTTYQRRSLVLWAGLRSEVPVPGLEAATHLHCHAHDTTLPAASAPFPGFSTGCPGSASSMGPLHLKGRCQVLRTVFPASLGLVPARLQVCTTLGTLAGTAHQGHCDMSFMSPITLGEGKCEVTTST